MAGNFDMEGGRGAALGGVRGYWSSISACLSQLLKSKGLASLFSGINQDEIVVRRDFPSCFPSRHSRVGLVDVFCQLGHGRPNFKNLFHAKALRILRITVNTQIAKCDPQVVYLGLPQL